jgi:hypothetical protein
MTHKNIAIGTDFNAPLPPPGPRFGNDKCPGGGTSTKPQLSYPFTSLFDNKQIDRETTGSRTFDINYDGVVQIGMLPDMFADLQTQGMSISELDPLYNSARAYVEMWKKADSIHLKSYLKNISKQDIVVQEVGDTTKYVVSYGQIVPTSYENFQRCYVNAPITILPKGVVANLPRFTGIRPACWMKPIKALDHIHN